MRKVRIGMFFLIVFLILTPLTSVHASGISEQLFITVKINGRPIFMDTDPYIKSNRTYVPIRFVAEAFNMQVDWIQDEEKAILKNDTTTIEMWLNSNKLVVNNEPILIDVPIEGNDGRIMVPIRFLAEFLNFTIFWDDTTCSVLLFKEDIAVPASSVLNRSYTDDDLIWLSRIVHVEGRNISLDGKIAIANVVLNRMKSPNFPDTVYDVIFDKRYTKQFPPAHKSGFRELVPDRSCVVAAKMALEGINNIEQCLFFNNKPFSGKERDLYTVIQGEHFYN